MSNGSGAIPDNRNKIPYILYINKTVVEHIIGFGFDVKKQILHTQPTNHVVAVCFPILVLLPCTTSCLLLLAV